MLRWCGEPHHHLADIIETVFSLMYNIDIEKRM